VGELLCSIAFNAQKVKETEQNTNMKIVDEIGKKRKKAFKSFNFF